MQTIDYTPREYGPLITNFVLDKPRCCIFAGMGLGKTVCVYTALDILFALELEKPVLILAPLRVANDVWPDEQKKWKHLKNLTLSKIIGSPKEREAALKIKADVYTCNYENLPWLVEYLGDSWPFGTVIADESTRLKSFRLMQGGKRTRALARVAHKYVDRWVNLTGTPAPNGLLDLWGQLWFIDGGQRLGRSFTAFTQRYFRPTWNGYGYEPLPFAREQIEAKIKDVCLTIDAKDYFNLDEPIVNNIYVELPPKARALYKEMEKELFIEIGDNQIEAFNAASKTIKCLQLASGAIYAAGEATENTNKKWLEVHDAKIQALQGIIEESSGAPILVAYHFKSDLERLTRAFPKARTLDTNPQTVKDWNDGKIQLLFAHPASAGHGLNLQSGGNILAFFSHWWNLEEYQQIIERIGPVRQKQAGFNRPVFLHNIIARDTIDELVIARRETKRDVQDLLLTAMKGNR
jgi:SNF2 family DNA or RNA helicase